MLSMPTNGGTESASTRSGPASQSAVVHSSANGQSAPNRSANVGNRASTSDKNARGGSTCAGPARGWRRGNLDNDDNAGDVPDRPPRKQRERWQTGRRAGGGCTPKRSPRLLLKTYLQVCDVTPGIQTHTPTYPAFDLIKYVGVGSYFDVPRSLAFK